MTLWARTYEFQTLFGENWSVELNEYDANVEYNIVANNNFSIDIQSYELNKYLEFLKGVGADEVEFYYEDGTVGFKLIIPKSHLPEDYSKTIEDIN